MATKALKKRETRARGKRVSATAARQEEDAQALDQEETEFRAPAPEQDDEPTQADLDERGRREAEALLDWMHGFINELDREATEREAKKKPTEDGWVEDLRQYYGSYDEKTEKELLDEEKSILFANKTRPKTDSCEARISDMLFPTDDKNWAISPTPVPELSAEAKRSSKQAEELTAQANAAHATQGPEAGLAVATQASAAAQAAKQAEKEMEVALERSKAMSAEIEDQLVECDYAIQMRDVIRDACRIGTGVSKGPIGSSQRSRRAWRKTSEADASGAAIYELTFTEDRRPAFVRVDPWSLFPDPDARRPRDSEDWYERHLLKPKGLRALARQPGYNKDAIRALLKEGPNGDAPQYLQQIRAITNEAQPISGKVYKVWEYRGSLNIDDMRRLIRALKDEKLAAIYDNEDEEFDVLEDIPVVVIFCQGQILKFGIHHLDSAESIYSFFCLEEDDAAVWGFGVPRMMRDSQAAMNGAWRMIMDNAGLSSGPQIVICQQKVKPEDGDWSIRPKKVWIKQPGVLPQETVFEVHEIGNNTGELLQIIEKAAQFIDEETNVSLIAQGEQGTHTTQTSGGMAILMNAVNVVFRRFIRNFDDNVTIPNLRRAYDWNMQFNRKDHIKGDFEVSARGSSVLLVREIQTQNLANLIGMAANPMVSALIKSPELLRKLVSSMMINPDEVVKTDDEIEADQRAAAAAGPQVSEAEETKRMKTATDADVRIRVAYIAQETALMGYAEKRNISMEQAANELEKVRLELASKERLQAGEIGAQALLAQTAAAAGGPAPKGGGGYV